MPIIGAFMGGTAGTIPSGYGVLEMYWTTNDGENMSGVTFNISNGTSLVADSNGFAKATLPVGTYTVSVTHGGIYGGDGEKTVTISNRETVSLIWSASRIYKQSVSLLFPTSASANWTVTNSSGTVEYSGTSISSSISFQLYPGVYTFSMTLYEDTVSKTLEISSSGTFDMSDLFCKITVSQPFPGSVLGVTYNGNSIGSVTSFYVVRTTSSRALSFSGTIPSYAGASSSAIAELKSSSVTPSSAEVTVKPSVVGKIVLLTNSGTLTIPVAGRYSVFCMGGGASSMHGYWGGGGSGYVVYDTFDVPAGDITVTIGSPGGTTSFGTIASASGGSMSSNYNGGEGGAGGGGGSTTGSNKKGGKGYFGGGGGGGGAQGSSNYTGGTAGAGGAYGGNGGRGGSSKSSGSAVAGSSGKSASSEAGALYYSGSYGGGSAGKDYGGGGGGGGGFGAVGGKGGPGTDTSYGSSGGGGGGGGGIAGGTGGNGSGVRQTATAGRGYGAGGRGGESASNANIGGGGGGYGSTQIANGPDGAKGCVVIRWMS